MNLTLPDDIRIVRKYQACLLADAFIVVFANMGNADRRYAASIARWLHREKLMLAERFALAQAKTRSDFYQHTLSTASATNVTLLIVPCEFLLLSG